MTQIIAEYSSIKDYMHDAKNNPSILQPDYCEDCGSRTFSLNGFYPRKSEGRGKDVDIKNGSLEIRRFRCSGPSRSCSKSYSILPSLIPPLRWYLWCLQQFVLALFIIGVSIHQIVQQIRASRSTITRWINWAKAKWERFCNELMVESTWLCKASRFAQFYRLLFERWTLSEVMCKLYGLGLAIPG